MNCPSCGEILIVLEYDCVEVDYCASCQGVWLDAGEIELLFGDADACHAFMKAGSAASAAREKARRCPICRKRMIKDVSGGEKPVTYDRCSRGHGLWFDKGELEVVLRCGATAAGDTRVPAFLREVFAADIANPGRRAGSS